jgi:hypothetical protein
LHNNTVSCQHELTSCLEIDDAAIKQHICLDAINLSGPSQRARWFYFIVSNFNFRLPFFTNN